MGMFLITLAWPEIMVVFEVLLMLAAVMVVLLNAHLKNEVKSHI